MGVVTITAIPEGRSFGPYPRGHAVIDPAIGIAWRVHDRILDERMVQVDVSSSGVGNEWLPLVQSAQKIGEQNLEAVEKCDSIHYIATRNIEADEELIVWYSKEYAETIGFPQVEKFRNPQKGGSFTCPHCQKNFQLDNQLTAHMFLLCKNQLTGTRLNVPGKDTDDDKYKSNPSPRERKRHFEDENQNSIKQKKTLKLSESIERDVSPKNVQEHEKTDTTNNKSAFRKVDKSNTGLVQDKESRNGLDLSGHGRVAYSRPFLETPGNDTNLRIPKPMGPSSPTSTSHSSEYLYNQNPFMSFLKSPTLPLPNAPINLSSKMSHVFPANPLEYSSYRSLIGKPIQDGAVLTGGIAFPGSQQKITYGGDPRPPMVNVGFLPKTSNPMVEKMLTTSPLMGSVMTSPVRPPAAVPFSNITAQNWCAKCNATFRMTSDLVYHMRSHHKKEPDLDRKKREEKLRCNVCNETFKERHHLTRHMTSHL